MTQCEVSLNTPECLGGVVGERMVRCFSCGATVCKNCSTLTRRYYRWRRVRICADCQEDRREDVAAGAIVLATPPATPVQVKGEVPPVSR